MQRPERIVVPDFWTGGFTKIHWGVLLAIFGNLLIACALALQKWVHKSLAKQFVEGVPEAERPSENRHPLFWLALFGLIIGELGNFAAFGLASPTIVSPLGCVAVIANALIAFFFLHERFHWRNALGLFLTLLGSAVVVLNAPAAIDDLSNSVFLELIVELPATLYLSTVGVSCVVLFCLAPVYGSRFLLINVMLCALLGSITVLCSAAVSNFFSSFLEGNTSELLNPITVIIIPIMFSTGAFQLKYLNDAMKYFPSNEVVPLYYVTFTLCSISGGGIVFQDFWGFEMRTAVGFIFGCFFCFLGVYLITFTGTVTEQYVKLADVTTEEPSEFILGAAALADDPEARVSRASTSSCGSLGRGSNGGGPRRNSGNTRFKHEVVQVAVLADLPEEHSVKEAELEGFQFVAAPTRDRTITRSSDPNVFDGRGSEMLALQKGADAPLDTPNSNPPIPGEEYQRSPGSTSRPKGRPRHGRSNSAPPGTLSQLVFMLNKSLDKEIVLSSAEHEAADEPDHSVWR